MYKEIYLVEGDIKETFASFKNRIAAMVSAVNNALQPTALKFTITEKAPPSVSIIPFCKKKIAVISIHKADRLPVEQLLQTAGFRGAYLVQEALPVSYKKQWNDGEVTPGVCLLTLFSKKKGLDYAAFIDRWHNGHTPLSLRIHPLWNYVRNEVKETISAQAPVFNGIVEEQVKTAADLLNPFRFFGNPLIIIPRMITVYADTKSFIDYASMETYLAMEYHVRSA